MKINDSFEDENCLCLVMDLMVEDLRHVFAVNKGPLEEVIVRRLFTTILLSVEHCQKNNVIHRDIKMENFLVDVDLQTNQIDIKLSDFGISLILPENNLVLGRAGTLVVMAPEVINQ